VLRGVPAELVLQMFDELAHLDQGSIGGRLGRAHGQIRELVVDRIGGLNLVNADLFLPGLLNGVRLPTLSLGPPKLLCVRQSVGVHIRVGVGVRIGVVALRLGQVLRIAAALLRGALEPSRLSFSAKISFSVPVPELSSF